MWQHWPRANAKPPVDWKFLVTAGAEQSRPLFPFDIEQFEKSQSSLGEALNKFDGATVILQYVGYAFAPDGAPMWLPAALQSWKQSGAGRKVFVNFHETWASGKPWESAFWTKPKQKRCAAALMQVADASATTNPATLRDLDSLRTGKRVAVIPIGSNLLVEETPEKNWRQMVIFGKLASRLRALHLHEALLKTLAAAAAVDTIVLAGESPLPNEDPSVLLLKSWNLPFKVESVFNFSAAQLPDSVKSSGLSLMHTSTTCLLKSGCFQLAAHLGQVAITVLEEDPGAPIIPGRHCLAYRVNRPSEIVEALKRPEGLLDISCRSAEAGATTLSWTAIAEAWDRLITATAG